MKLLIVSDIHGNWAALETVLNAESDADRILCLGDLVGYGPEPAACVNWAIQRRTGPFSCKAITIGALHGEKIREVRPFIVNWQSQHKLFA
jgi:Calcineurin-like phosphoesterase superfamily domain